MVTLLTDLNMKNTLGIFNIHLFNRVRSCHRVPKKGCKLDRPLPT